MAVSNPCRQKEWDEWKEQMEENRKKRWREWVRRYAEVKVSSNAKDQDEQEEDEADDTDFEEGESEENGELETEMGEGEDVEIGEAEWIEDDKEVWVQRRDKEIEKEDREEDNGVVEAEDVVDFVEKVKEEDYVEGENVLDEDKKEVTKAEELEEGEKEKVDELEREVKKNNMEDEELDVEVEEAWPVKEELKEGDNVEDREVFENKDVEEDKVVTEFERLIDENADMDEGGMETKVEDIKKEEENDVEREAQESGEEEELTKAEGVGGDQDRHWEVEEAETQEKRATEGENDFYTKVRVKEEEDRQSTKEGDQFEEEEEEEEQKEYQEQAESEQYRLPDFQFQRQNRGIWGQDIQENQESTMQANQDEHLKSDFMGSDEEWLMFERIKNEQRAVSVSDSEEHGVTESFPVPLTSKERRDEEERSQKLINKTVAESKTTEVVFQIDHGKLPEEEDESTEDEEAEHSSEEEPDPLDEDEVKMYSKDDYPVDVFHTLTEFRESLLFTDLTLSTEDGTTFQVHSLVMGAVSSFIRESLIRGKAGNERVDGRQDEDSVGVCQWSLPLGPEVNRVGLEAVVEFAYTGLMTLLRENTLDQIKAAAQTLRIQRVLDLCIKEEEKSTKTGGKRKDDRVSAADQLRISLQSMKQLQMDRVGCDVTLEAVGGPLHVHRVILAVGSDYFRSMFTLQMKESNQPCVTLPFLLASELEILIGCSYSGVLPLSWKCVFEITSTALQLQYQPALSLCLNFLQQEINPHFCLDVVSFAEAYEIVQLLEVADDYVLRQFQKVACTSKFKDLPAKQLLKYLNSNSLCVPSELVVFKAVVAWIQAKPKIRLNLAKELMKTIQFTLMTFKEFKEVQSLNMWSDHSLAELFDTIIKDFCSNDFSPLSQYRIYLPKESLVLIGGDQTSEDLSKRSISRELWFGNSLRNHTGIRKAMEWRKLGDMPEHSRFKHEVSVLKGQLYVFGGKKYYGTNDTLNSVYRYDPLQNNWERLADMQQKRSTFSAVVLDGEILAIGGHSDLYFEESVEQYCPTANLWRFTLPLDLPLGAHVAKVLQGQIYVSGGLNNDHQCVSSMFLYHPETGSTYLANMAQARAYHCMETLGECLYVAGGISTVENINVVDQLACEMYNPAADFWTAFTSLSVPHVGAGSAVLEGKFYVLGGYSHENYSDIKMVHRYDPSAKRWENMGKMPGPNNDIRASLLCLPQHFRL